jgi:hypothetical protein
MPKVRKVRRQIKSTAAATAATIASVFADPATIAETSSKLASAISEQKTKLKKIKPTVAAAVAAAADSQPSVIFDKTMELLSKAIETSTVDSVEISNNIAKTFLDGLRNMTITPKTDEDIENIVELIKDIKKYLNIDELYKEQLTVHQQEFENKLTKLKSGGMFNLSHNVIKTNKQKYLELMY